MKSLIRLLNPTAICVAALAAALPVAAQTTDTWNGSVDANWSTAGNWTPGTPGAGDSLIFSGTVNTAANNDLTANTAFGGIIFDVTATSSFDLTGNAINFAGIIENDSTTPQALDLPIVLTGATTVNVTNGGISIGLNAGGISGTGPLIVNGALGGGELTVSNKTYSGGTTINGGVTMNVWNDNGSYTLAGGSLLLNYGSFYSTPTFAFTADSSLGVNVAGNYSGYGRYDCYGNVGSPGYKWTVVGTGRWQMHGAAVLASSVDVTAPAILSDLPNGYANYSHLGTNTITVESGAALRINNGGIVLAPIELHGGQGPDSQGALVANQEAYSGNGTNAIATFSNSITLFNDGGDTYIGAQTASGNTIGANMVIAGGISGPGGLQKIGPNSLNLSGSNSYAGATTIGISGTLNSGGTLQLASSNALPATTALTIFENSTLDLNGSAATVASLADDVLGLATVDNSSANAASLKITNSGTFYGKVKNTGGGALSVINVNGNTTLLGANSYSGANIVQSGTLEINIPSGNATGGLVQIADGSTLTLHKTTPASSLKAAGATIGAAGATTLNIDLGNYGNPSVPVINATNGTGVLAANGTLTVTFNNTANLSVGQFPIIKYGSRTGTGNFVLTPISGIGAQIVTNAGNKSIDLQITSAPITTWKGSLTNNLWDIATTTNWTYSGSPTLYSDGSAVFFDDTALTNKVNLTTALSPGSVLMNSTNTYTFGGTGPLNGGTLTKNGSGTLIMQANGNGYSSTTIGGGALQIGNNDGNGDLGSGTVDDEATLTFNRSNALTVANTISGAGQVIQNNTNTTTLSVANTFTGGTLVNQGVLKLGNSAALGVPAGLAATVASGAALDLGGKLVSGVGYISINGSGLNANTGALMTSAGMGCTIGCGGVGAKFLRLAGNATIGDSSGDFLLGTDSNANGTAAGVGSIDGQGYSLIKVGNNTLVLDATNVTALSQFVIAAGQVLYANTGKTPFGTTATLVISNNTYMDAWDNYANSGITVANNIVIGAGGGQLWNTRGMYYGHACYNTYSGSLTLNATLALRNTATYGGSPGNVATSGSMTFSGPISGSGGISCTNGSLYTVGATTSINTVTLSGANTYSGATVVNLGVLQLSASQQGGGAYLVYDNSTLDVPTQTGYSNVPMSSLMLGAANGGTLNLGRVTALSTLNAPIMATNLTVIGTNSILLPPVAYASAPGEYPLIKYTTGPSGYGSVGLIVVGGGVRGVPGYITNDTANSQIALVVPGGTPVVWTGTNSLGNWDIATSLNWATNATATTYQQTGSLGDVVTFNDSSSQTNVNVTVPVAPTAAIFNITNKNYLLFGTNLTGAASLVKNGSGTLVLSNRNNNFTGGAIVNGGTLTMGTSLSPFVALNNLNGTVTVNSGATLDMGSNNPTALTVNISGSGVGGNGALQANYTGTAVAWGPSVVNLLANATIGGNNRWDLRSGSIKLNAANPNTTLTKTGSALIALVAATVSTNIGDVVILGGQLGYQTSTAGLGSTNGTLYIGASGQLELYQASVPLVKNIVCTNGAKIFAESGNTAGQNVLAGPITLVSGSTTFRANYSFSGLYVSNTISGAGGLSIEGQTYVYLAASNTFAGQLYVPNCNAASGGRGTRLSFIGNGSAMNCNQIYLQGIASGQAYAGWISMDTPGNTLTLGTNQQLRGDNGAYVRGSVVAPAGSSLAVGQAGSTNYQYMIIGTNLTLQAGSTNYMEIFKAASLTTNSQLYVSNSLTLGGTLVIGTNGATVPLVAGDAFKLFFAGSTSGAFTNVVPVPGAGLVWDTSALVASGTISVKAVSSGPASTNIVYGNNATFTANTTLSAPSYQWYDKNTNVIGGATSATLTLTKPAVAASGNYSCVISQGGAAATVVSALTVTPAALSITASNITKNFGATYTFAGNEFFSSGLVTGDSISSVSLTSAGAAGGAAVNTYPITPSAASGTGLANYTITYNNGTLTVVQTLPSTGTNITFSATGNTLTLNWPTNYIGWLLQSNSVDLANTNYWFTVPGSAATNQVIISVNPANAKVFYRMAHP
jgi:fibronectin-binding autotransporter adhesin